MTPIQFTAFKAALLADVNLASFRSVGDTSSIVTYYNGSAGAGSIWRPNISIAELNTAIVWSEFAALSNLLQTAYIAMTQNGIIDATSVNIRNGFSTIFAGKTTLTNLVALAQRVPTRFEALFTTSNISSAFGITVSQDDVTRALGA